MRQHSRLLGSSALVFLAAAALAQPPGPPPGGGFGRRFIGGPGMGQGPAMLLRIPEVRKELATTEAQNPKIDRLLEDLERQMQASFTGIDFRDLQDLSEADRQKRFEEIRKKSEQANKQADEKLAQLLDAPQFERLKQLDLQRAGPAALQRPEIAKLLALTPEQQEKLRKLQGDRPPFGPPGFGPPGFGPDNRQQGELLAVLAPEQKAKWNELRGKEFKFPDFMMGFGPPGGPGQQRKLLKQFDKNGDGRLDVAERQAARESLKKEGRGRGGFGRGPGGPGGFGPPGFGRDNQDPPKPGPHVSPADVPAVKADLYDPAVLRTVFIDFEDKAWEAELADFYHSDVEVPATLTVDGKKYPNVGVHFRGMSSYMMVPAGRKRSLNVSLDFVDKKQRLLGYKTLNLLNSHDDPSMLSTVLFSHIARKHIPAPKANFIKVVINGESWGVYVNAQQFDKIFMTENFGSDKGARWKVRGSPGGQGGLEYLGDNVEDYKRRYEIKSGDDKKSWKAFMTLCKTLNQTPPEQLEEALKPMLDIDGALWFLALDVALINNDGYWVRASDYSIALDSKGKFHIIPHDMNEAFQAGMGPGMGGPPGKGRAAGREPPEERGRAGGRQPPEPSRPGSGPGGRFNLDPLVALNDPRKPLRSKLLAVPRLRAKYLEHVRSIAEESLGWQKLGPVVGRFRELIEQEVEADTRKVDSLASFKRAVADTVSSEPERGPRGGMSLKAFADQRRDFLLNHAEVKKAAQQEQR